MILTLCFTAAIAMARDSVESLIKVRDFPQPRSLSEASGFKKIQNGRIERNPDIYGRDSWVIQTPFCKNGGPCAKPDEFIRVECVANPPGYCETSSSNGSRPQKPGVPYRYRAGNEHYLLVAGPGREDGEEFITVLAADFKELCQSHNLSSYRNGSILKKVLKNPAKYLKWAGSKCEFTNIPRNVEE